MIERAEFGRTGHRSSRVIFGAAALSRVPQDVADEVLALLPEFGVNHVDTAAMYGGSEERLAPWLRTHRSSVFLATKTGDRDGDSARRSLERSLTRMGVDSVDLIQLHNLVEEEDWAHALGPGGALEALVRARDEGLVRFLGVTGHGTRIPRMHLRSLERFPFDSVLFPYNWAMLRSDAYRADAEELLGVCADRGVAVQTIKSVARRRWPEGHEGPRTSWYQPIEDRDALGRAVRFVLSRPQLFVNSTSALGLIRPTLEAVAAGGPAPTDEELAADAEALGVTPLFDGAALERI